MDYFYVNTDQSVLINNLISMFRDNQELIYNIQRQNDDIINSIDNIIGYNSRNSGRLNYNTRTSRSRNTRRNNFTSRNNSNQTSSQSMENFLTRLENSFSNNNVNTNIPLNRQYRMTNTQPGENVLLQYSITLDPSYNSFINYDSTDASNNFLTALLNALNVREEDPLPTDEEIDEATEMILYSNLSHDEKERNPTCPITLEGFQDHDTVLKIKHCGHMFKERYLKRHFRTSSKCPVCRHSIVNGN